MVNAAENALIMLNSLPLMRFKNDWKRTLQKTAKPAGDLIGNKIANRITEASKKL